MKPNTITKKQFGAMILVSMLSPLLRSLPRATVHFAGKGAWLSVLPAFFLLLIMLSLQKCLFRRLPPGKGYADILWDWLGPVAGRLALALYGLWFLFYAGFVLRSGTERLVAVVYPQSPLFPILLVMTTLCLLAALGTLRATGRAAVLLRTFLLAALGLVFLFASPNISRENLTPIPWDNGTGILLGSLPIAAVAGLMGSFPFLMGYVDRKEAPGRKAIFLILAVLLIAWLLCFEVVGTFGAVLTETLSYPFFLMVRDISLFHITQRVEAVVIVLWIFADFILCTSMLRCAHECIRKLFSLPAPETEPVLRLKHGRWLLWLEAGLILLFSLLVPNSALDLELWSDHLIPLCGVLMMYVGLPVAFLLGRLRGKTGITKGHGP